VNFMTLTFRALSRNNRMFLSVYFVLLYSRIPVVSISLVKPVFLASVQTWFADFPWCSLILERDVLGTCCGFLYGCVIFCWFSWCIFQSVSIGSIRFKNFFSSWRLLQSFFRLFNKFLSHSSNSSLNKCIITIIVHEYQHDTLSK